MTNLNSLLASAMRESVHDIPRASEAETVSLLRGYQAAMDRPSEHFVRGMKLRIKPDLNIGLYKDENPIYVFESYLEHPINPLDYAEGIREALSSQALAERDCIVLALAENNEVILVAVAAAWFEEDL